MFKSKSPTRRSSTIIALIIAGESIFFLPFVLVRIFRPTLLIVFDITNTELGTYFSIYGIVAMFSYFFGGPLADKFPSRKLMSFALWLTSLGGMLMYFVPLKGSMMFLYAFWGLTTILLFWAALIRATREWGGADSQGRAFGWLEAGRGTTAALLGTMALLIFSDFSPESTSQANHSADRISAFLNVVLFTSIFTMISGVLVWRFVPDNKQYRPADRVRAGQIISLMKYPSIWLLSVIIICAYVGYKMSDYLSLYANEVLGYSELNSAALTTGAIWMRAFVAILAGYLADKINASKIIFISFALTLLGAGLLALGLLDHTAVLVLINLTLVLIGVYGLRSLYFALIQEARIPIFYTGTAVGIISILGFTPDIFLGPWMGYLLDNNPGAEGHHKVYAVMTLFAVLGLVASFLFISHNKKGIPTTPPR